MHIRHNLAFRLQLDHGAHRHFNRQGLSGFSLAQLCTSVLSGLCRKLALEPEIHKGMHIGISQKHDVPAVAAVAAVRSAVLHELFPVERHAAVAAVAGFGRYFYLIYKHILSPPYNRKIPP